MPLSRWNSELDFLLLDCCQIAVCISHCSASHASECLSNLLTLRIILSCFKQLNKEKSGMLNVQETISGSFDFPLQADTQPATLFTGNMVPSRLLDQVAGKSLFAWWAATLHGLPSWSNWAGLSACCFLSQRLQFLRLGQRRYHAGLPGSGPEVHAFGEWSSAARVWEVTLDLAPFLGSGPFLSIAASCVHERGVQARTEGTEVKWTGG